MNFYTDQLNQTIEIKSIPEKIISLVPSQTELLFDLGLGEAVIGITKFCIHPQEWHKSKPRVGGTKNLNIKKIKSLAPDLIIGNKEENDEGQIKELMKLFPVWMSDIKNLNDAKQMIDLIGGLTNKKTESKKINIEIENNFSSIKSKAKNEKQKTAYIIWKNPLMTVGSDTFVHDMMIRCGFENAFENKTRYPEISMNELKQTNPDVILLSSEPFPFKEKHIEEFKIICPHAKVILTDGEMFSWYGSRLIKAPSYFITLIKEIRNAY